MSNPECKPSPQRVLGVALGWGVTSCREDIIVIVNMSEDKWREKLTPEQYHVLREKGTEPAFTGKYVNTKDKGMYRCVACGNELFSSDTKFDSGSGWPSFTEPANRENVKLEIDNSLGMERVEVLCKQCGSHLGHVFDDGPKDKGGQRYCINSCALDLNKEI